MLEGEIFQRSQTVFRVFHVFPLVRACSLVCSIVFHAPLLFLLLLFIFSMEHKGTNREHSKNISLPGGT